MRSLVVLKSTSQTTAGTITPSIIKETFVTVALMNTDSFMSYSAVILSGEYMDMGRRKKQEDEGVHNLFEGEMTWSHCTYFGGKKFVTQL